MAISQFPRRIARQARDFLIRIQKTRMYRPTGGQTREAHFQAATEWLARAQDHGSNRGVSTGGVFGEGFGESYPETTGYIIPTFLALASRSGDRRWRDRAIEAGRWESAVQMAEGAVMGSLLNSKPSPAVFNTGMVLLGWAALIRETGEDGFKTSAQRACNWLLKMQDPDGCWRRGNSRFCCAETTLYNVKAAWGLCEAGFALNHQPSIEAAQRNAAYTLTQQLPNGWYANCCLSDATRPLLHTIAYTMQGLMGIARLTRQEELIVSASRCADRLFQRLAPDGFLAGRWDQEWNPAVDWCCLTGSAQTGIVWTKLYEITGKPEYLEGARRVSGYLLAHHDITSPDPSIRGGMPGSWPVHGDYGRFVIQNWATNYFVELLLAEEQAAVRSPGGPQISVLARP